jgi:hypothetical protein
MSTPSFEDWMRILAIFGLILIHALPIPIVVEEAEGATPPDEQPPPLENTQGDNDQSAALDASDPSVAAAASPAFEDRDAGGGRDQEIERSRDQDARRQLPRPF